MAMKPELRRSYTDGAHVAFKMGDRRNAARFRCAFCSSYKNAARRAASKTSFRLGAARTRPAGLRRRRNAERVRLDIASELQRRRAARRQKQAMQGGLLLQRTRRAS
eukprot:9483232-Pyramimonas_sp.AAC.1